ncbi:mycoredoxin [Streptomyces gobiensis]|uniref:mycoredoxin n=1 Tax=Streptomyces gobiensis TaxID=2875706 RepID=UPI001E48C0E5|nr:mycoredoxin [Streptomyces gobiensis]UGY94615.1 mycoredoxin [Streptomyces gobiensis]
MTSSDTVHVYWRPGCPYCAMLRRGLKRTGLPVEWHNIWTDQRAAARVRAVTGGDETVPTVEIAGKAMVNPTTQQVLTAVRERAPHLAPPEPQPRRSWLPWRRRTVS